MRSPLDQTVLAGAAFNGLLETTGLASRTLIAVGSSSVVIEDTTSSIFRISSDASTQFLANVACRLNLQGVVKLIDDYGAVRVYEDLGDDSVWLWMAKLERLTDLSSSTDIRSYVEEFVDYIECETGDTLIGCQDLELLTTALATASPHPCLSEVVDALKSLIPHMKINRLDADLNVTNFMLQPSTGLVVLADPAHGGLVPSAQRLAALSSHDCGIQSSLDTAFHYSYRELARG